MLSHILFSRTTLDCVMLGYDIIDLFKFFLWNNKFIGFILSHCLVLNAASESSSCQCVSERVFDVLVLI